MKGILGRSLDGNKRLMFADSVTLMFADQRESASRQAAVN